MIDEDVMLICIRLKILVIDINLFSEWFIEAMLFGSGSIGYGCVCSDFSFFFSNIYLDMV